MVADRVSTEQQIQTQATTNTIVYSKLQYISEVTAVELTRLTSSLVWPDSLCTSAYRLEIISAMHATRVWSHSQVPDEIVPPVVGGC